jgi:hypothetical protein
LEALFCPTRELPKVASARILRWANIMLAYDYKIEYRPGSEIPHADAMTRLRFAKSALDDEQDNEVTCFCDEISDVWFTELPSVISHDEVRSEYVHDPTSKRVFQRITSGDWTNCSEIEMPFKRISQTLTLEDGLIYVNSNLYIPPALREKVIKVAHQSHLGINATQAIAIRSTFWPNMYRDIERYVNSCVTCQSSRPRVESHRSEWPKTGPRERWHIDWAYIKDVGEILIMVDAGSGWIEAKLCPNRETDSVIACLSALFGVFGIPKTVVSDNAKEFVSDALSSFLKANGCEKIESPVYSPQSNGIAERAVRTVKQAMKSWNPRMRIQFHVFLNKVLLTHRNTSRVRGQTPAEFMFGQNVRIPVAVPYPVGECVLFKPTVKSNAEKVTYVIRAGRNTAFIRTCDERTLLASDNQIAPSGVDDTKQIECLGVRFEEVPPPSTPESPTISEIPIPPPEARTSSEVPEPPRRSQRERRPNPRYLD